MNRNVESRFALNPTSLDVRRSIFDRSSSVKFSGNIGECIPFYVDEVLPGDTFNIKTSKVVRLQTPLHPIMDNMYLDTYYFFVPNRLVWDHWKNFCGESENAWLPETEYYVPELSIKTHPGTGSLADYMGIPLTVTGYTAGGIEIGTGVNALPFRAYAKIMDDWFRDQNLTDPLVIYTGDSSQECNTKESEDIYCALGGPVFHASKYHDYFTSCLPAPQSGPDTLIPTIDGSNGLAKVGTGSVNHDGIINGNLGIYFNNGSITRGLNTTAVEGTNAWTATSSSTSAYSPVNLYADVGATLGTINDLRIAFQVQKFYEKMSYGRRYIEILKSQFGVTSPDARLQRSEYLGGNRVPINIHEVTNNSEAENSFVGDLGAMSRTVDVNSDFVHSFTEHGFVLGICVIRYDHTYGQGIERFWTRTNKFDYYWPVFANIGNQAVKKQEIFYDSTTQEKWQESFDVFGYQEAWADYRYKPNRCAGLMRPEAEGTLASWHLADDYDQYPTLSDSWIREDKTNVDRTLAVTSAVSDQFYADIYIQNTCTRVMPMYSIPGLADHH